jgi:hypothetical protein
LELDFDLLIRNGSLRQMKLRRLASQIFDFCEKYPVRREASATGVDEEVAGLRRSA